MLLQRRQSDCEASEFNSKDDFSNINQEYLARSVMGELVKREVGSLSGPLTPHSMQVLAPTVLQRLLETTEWRGLLTRTLPEVAASSIEAATCLREERPLQGDSSSLASTWNQAGHLMD
jgi:hypothetical protein